MEKKYEEVEAKIGEDLQETEAVQGVSFDSIPSGTIQLGDEGVFTGGNVTVKGVVKEQPISFGEGTTDEEIAKALDEAAKTAEPTPEEIENALNKVRMEENYLRQQAQHQLQMFLNDVGVEAFQEIMFAILIEAGLTTKEAIGKRLKEYTANRVKELYKEMLETREEAKKIEIPEEFKDNANYLAQVELKTKSIDIMTDEVSKYIEAMDKVMAEEEAATEEAVNPNK